MSDEDNGIFAEYIKKPCPHCHKGLVIKVEMYEGLFQDATLEADKEGSK